MLKWGAILIISVGIFFIGIGCYHYIKTKVAQENSLSAAYELLESPKNVAVNGKKGESFTPLKGETVGILYIPKIEAELPIVEGTSEEELEKGVGHYDGTAYPTQEDQIVLSGHRDTVFQRMGELDIGDLFIVKLPYGSFLYKISSTKIVDADDRSIIKSTAPDEELVVTTCYPFTYVGDAPERYILIAKPFHEK